MKKFKLILLSTLSILTLTSCDTELIKDRISLTINEMLPNLWLTLVQLGIFILIAVLFIVIFYKPIKKKLNERAEHIEKNIKDSELKNEEADKNLMKANDVINDAELRAGEIIKAAQKTAEVKAHDVEIELNKVIEEQKEIARKDIENERNKMLNDTKDEIVESAISCSKMILKREINEDDNKAFLNDFVNELNKGKEINE